MKVLVIGGNRFVGKILTKKIVEEDRYNYVDVFNRSGTGHWGVDIIQGNRNNIEDLKQIDFSKYDCIVDMCLFKLEQFNLIKDLIPEDVNYIFVSSGAVDYIDTFGEYAKDKEDVELALSKTNINYKIVRPSYIVGKGNHRPRLGYFISQLKNKEIIEMSGDGNYPINLVFVQDVVNCLMNLIKDDNRTYKTYNICGDKSITINELIDFLKFELNILHHMWEDISEVGEALFPNQVFEFDNSDIKRDYDINFTDLEIGIKEYIKESDEF